MKTYEWIEKEPEFKRKNKAIRKFEKASKNEKVKWEFLIESILVNNIEVIEDGMTFITSQYKVKDGKIDILARDKNGVLCIIELKANASDQRIVYQCLYYPSQFNEKTRMITIAMYYPENIISVLKMLNNVEIKLITDLSKDIKIENLFQNDKIIQSRYVPHKLYNKIN